MTLERPKPKRHSHDTTVAVAGTMATVSLDVPHKDEPMNSRNSPTTLNILTCSTDKEDTFANRYEKLL